MPTTRMRAIRTRVGPGYMLTDIALRYFWWEGTITNEWAKGKSESEIKAFWKKHRQAILDWFIERNRQRNGEPGRRPSFFWDEIKAKRRKTRKSEGYFKPWTKDGPDLKEYRDPVYETDYQFLKRLGLLEGWEKERGKKQ